MRKNGIDAMDDALLQAGVTRNDMTTNAYANIKRAIEEHPEIALAKYPELIKDAEEILSELRRYVTSKDAFRISERKTTDALIAYRIVLQNTKEIFGEEKLTENVMMKAIEAASYIGYRSIMGEAAQSNRRY